MRYVQIVVKGLLLTKPFYYTRLVQYKTPFRVSTFS